MHDLTRLIAASGRSRFRPTSRAKIWGRHSRQQISRSSGDSKLVAETTIGLESRKSCNPYIQELVFPLYDHSSLGFNLMSGAEFCSL